MAIVQQLSIVAETEDRIDAFIRELRQALGLLLCSLELRKIAIDSDETHRLACFVFDQ